MARPRKPQTLEDTLKQIDLRIRQNENEHQSLLDERKKIMAQIEVQEFNVLREFLSSQGMTVHDLITKISSNAPIASGVVPMSSSSGLPDTMLAQ